MAINYVHWDINPEILNLFGLSLRYYGIIFVTGLVLSIYILKWIFKKESIPYSSLEKLSIYGIIGIFVGARLGHCLFYEPAYFLNHPLEIIIPIQQTNDGYKFTGYQGLASHGGTLGLLIALILYSRKTKQSIIKTLDLIAIVAPLAGCFIRIANLMNSEIIGIPTSVPWAFIFANEDNLPRHPAQLYEAIAYLFIFGLLLYKYIYNREKMQNGYLFGMALFLIFTARFFIEFVKEKQVAFENTMQLDMGQLLSIPLIVLGIGLMIFLSIKAKKQRLKALQHSIPLNIKK